MDENFDHTFLLLENPENKHFLASTNIEYVLIDTIADGLNNYFKNFDILQIEFWNHPLLYNFLFRNNPLRNTRLLCYSHVNGLYAPNIITEPLVELCDIFIGSSFATTHSSIMLSAGQRITIVPGFGGCRRTSGIYSIEHEDFNVVYIGSADRIKLNAGYVYACKEIVRRVPKARFIFCSQDDSSHVQEQVEEAGISDHFVFYRNLQDIGEILAIADVFGYPLNPHHFGTGEQALLEAMGAAIPSVVLNNLPERYIIDDGVTGIVVSSVSEYIEAIEFLYLHPALARVMGRRAREYAVTEMSEGKTLSRLNEVYRKAVTYEKWGHIFTDCDIIEQTGDDIGLGLFSISQGADGKMFLRALEKNGDARFWKWKISLYHEHLSPHKGTLAQYQAYFPESKGLAELLHIVKAKADGDDF